MANKKFVSKVDEKLKAAEARRAELERAKAEEIQKKIAMRRERMKKSETDENKINENSAVTVSLSEDSFPRKQRDIKEFGYMKLTDGKLIKLNWCTKDKKRNSLKLFTIKCVEALIEKEGFGLAEVILGIMKRSVEARHPIQNKFAHLHGRITEIKEKNRRTGVYEGGLNFVGSISPIRVPEFEVDMGMLSRISSPVGMEEFDIKYTEVESGHEPVTVNVTDTRCYVSTVDDSHSHFEYEEQPVKTPMKSPKRSNATHNFPTVISPMKRPNKEIEADVVYTPQRKSARRLNDEEIVYDNENVSQILLADPNAAFISNSYITMSAKKKKKSDDEEAEE